MISWYGRVPAFTAVSTPPAGPNVTVPATTPARICNVF
jgi:hypothetical protein